MTTIQKLNEAIQLRAENHLEDSNQVLIGLANEYPHDAFIQYQCAWSFDKLGKESLAVPYYEAALRGDLEEEHLQNAYLGLGSTYRALGEYVLSEKVLSEALRLFPTNEALKVFYALTLYNLRQHTEAMEILVTTVAETSSDVNIDKYKAALKFYADKLDETWD
jgi:tetratricopeptide (TPR) repeat protein